MDGGALAQAQARAIGLAGGVGHPVRRVLDYGAGQRHLVCAFRSLGLVADGVEPSLAGRDQARLRYGLELGSSLRPAGGERYDLIVLQRVLEHVAVLRDLSRRLDPLGSMLIEVPNASSFEMLRPSRRRVILDLPVHLYHFTPLTLSVVLGAAALEAVDVTLTNPDWLEWLFALRAHRAGRRTARTGRRERAAPDRAPHLTGPRFAVRGASACFPPCGGGAPLGLLRAQGVK